ncbi:hypothetical protein CBR_g31522 [Chara braunii]|uniref:GPI ethanolamine phosphate transferase 3 n=1 Tax=Chara braunii TaxID=69332 RepID=A0A388LF82_CHABU|nr:hypothetical protein CBR_g31522 [Chara braunii]|eukprot:GBG80965.1 hypothetical protein CBR_g31522 [Chara braunii]
MIGDDTWVQLFPDQFAATYPYPSFDVKDIHVVDNGVIDNIFPMLDRTDDWDVLIGHFLGVDHVGHTFRVDSPVMYEKLDQMNKVLEDVIAALQARAGAGGHHHDTLLLVMGDHGQTMTGDHGGGTDEEVNSAIFAMSMRRPPYQLPEALRSPPCNHQGDSDGFCISTFPQIDFAATISMILGIPIPYGSVGRVNPEVWALAANSWQQLGKPSVPGSSPPSTSSDSAVSEANKDSLSSESPPPSEAVKDENADRLVALESWMRSFARVLAVNSWQVQRYMEAYSKEALAPFPAADLERLRKLQTSAQLRTATVGLSSVPSSQRCGEREPCRLEGNAGERVEVAGVKAVESSDGNRMGRSLEEMIEESAATDLERRVEELKQTLGKFDYYLSAAAALARARWTQFDMVAIGCGLIVLFVTLAAHVTAIVRITSGVGSRCIRTRLPRRSMAFALLSVLIVGAFRSSTAVTVTAVSSALNFMLMRTRNATGTRTAVSDDENEDGDSREGAKRRRTEVGERGDERQKRGLDEQPRPRERRLQTRRQLSPLSWVDVRTRITTFFIVIYAASLSSNSFILEEGHMIHFFLASAGILYLRRAAPISARAALDAVLFMIATALSSWVGRLGASKSGEGYAQVEGGTAMASVVHSKRGLQSIQLGATCLLVWMLFKWQQADKRTLLVRLAAFGGIGMYILGTAHWLFVRNDVETPADERMQEFVRVGLPRSVYLIALSLLALVFFTLVVRRVGRRKAMGKARGIAEQESEDERCIVDMALSLVVIGSGPIALLLGQKGPPILVTGALQAYYLLRLQKIAEDNSNAHWLSAKEDETVMGSERDTEPLPKPGLKAVLPQKGRVHGSAAIEWGLLGIHLFHASGHRCTFDALKFSAAFIGYDNFHFFRCGSFLALETFGASHLLPTLAIPILALCLGTTMKGPHSSSGQRSSASDRRSYPYDFSRLGLIYLLVRALVAVVTTTVVTIHRRHLMTWGLFAPKFVFDAVSFLVVDLFLIVVAALAL